VYFQRFNTIRKLVFVHAKYHATLQYGAGLSKLHDIIITITITITFFLRFVITITITFFLDFTITITITSPIFKLQLQLQLTFSPPIFTKSRFSPVLENQLFKFRAA